MIGLSDTAYCQECNEFDDLNHFLLKCRKYTTQRLLLYNKFNNIFSYQYPYHLHQRIYWQPRFSQQDAVDQALQATYDHIISTRQPI